MEQRRLADEFAAAFRRWAEGDAVAMDDLIRLATPPMWCVARDQGLSPESAAGVIEATWFAVVRDGARLLTPQNALASILATVRHAARGHRRR
ncbi:hypothetical protein [Microbacterium marinilacus]|uniref:MftR C-terminal domain-containing protein n=1 Tax=Microbacterium marinilacus TaxID=415209 RepID=A0ABP7BVQ4_9MICO|nr:hypothetical protein [Microbacterium marinilacus]MBY0688026.1 hypothetical protein [Microbacterium marinilacus]